MDIPIGRELYTAPQIVVWQEDANQVCDVRDTGRKDKGGRPLYACYDKFSVRKCIIENHEIKALWIVDDTTGKTVFTMKPEAESA